jgi:hypothetical protein
MCIAHVCAHMYRICLMKVKCITKFITRTKKVSINTTYLQAKLQYFFSIRKCISTCGVLLLVAVSL